MRRLLIAGLSATLSVSLVAALAMAFTPAEKQALDKIRQRIGRAEARVTSLEAQLAAIDGRLAVLEQNDVEMDAGLTALVAPDGPLAELNALVNAVGARVDLHHDPITISEIRPLVTCDGTTCTVSVEWSSDPPATGQVEWGETLAYGNLTKPEPALLPFHRQRLGTFPQDGRTWHFRIIATTPDGSAVSPSTLGAGS